MRMLVRLVLVLASSHRQNHRALHPAAILPFIGTAPCAESCVAVRQHSARPQARMFAVPLNMQWQQLSGRSAQDAQCKLEGEQTRQLGVSWYTDGTFDHTETCNDNAVLTLRHAETS